MKVLVIEDEPAVVGFITQALTESGYTADAAHSAREAEDKLREGVYDLVLLDLQLPDADGLEWMAALRRMSSAPVLMVTARGSLEDRVSGLDAGADDYLTKPFRLEELLARVRALLRRTRADQVFHLGPLSIDFVTRRVMLANRTIFLSTTEFELLEMLAKTPGRPVSKIDILKRVWDDPDRDTNLVEVYVNYIRHKLERGGAPRLVHTVRGQGYILALEE